MRDVVTDADNISRSVSHQHLGLGLYYTTQHPRQSSASQRYVSFINETDAFLIKPLMLSTYRDKCRPGGTTVRKRLRQAGMKCMTGYRMTVSRSSCHCRCMVQMVHIIINQSFSQSGTLRRSEASGSICSLKRGTTIGQLLRVNVIIPSSETRSVSLPGGLKMCRMQSQTRHRVKKSRLCYCDECVLITNRH